MKSKNVEKKVSTQDLHHGAAQLPEASQHIKRLSHKTFSPKLARYNEIEIAEEYEQALEANSLEKINSLLAKLVDLSEN